MNGLVMSVSEGLAAKTSRRGLLGRTGKGLLGLVAGSAMYGLMAESAHAYCRSNCPSPCKRWYTCHCYPRLRMHVGCPSCSYELCYSYQCTNLAC